MKKKNLIIILLLVFILTGCNAKYSLKVENNMIKEYLEVLEDSNSPSVFNKDEFGSSFYDYSKRIGEEKNIDTSFDAYYSQTGCVSDCSFYEKEFVNDNGVVGFKLSHNFTFDEYSSSTIGREYIPGFSSTYDGKYLRILGGPRWNYFDDYSSLEKIDFTIETEYKVVSTNLKKVKDGVYKKTISKEDSRISITLDTTSIASIEKNNSKKSNGFIVFLIIFGATLLITFIVFIFNNRKKNE